MCAFSFVWVFFVCLFWWVFCGLFFLFCFGVFLFFFSLIDLKCHKAKSVFMPPGSPLKKCSIDFLLVLNYEHLVAFMKGAYSKISESMQSSQIATSLQELFKSYNSYDFMGRGRGKCLAVNIFHLFSGKYLNTCINFSSVKQWRFKSDISGFTPILKNCYGETQ